jgi:hypothetical protein
MQGLRTDYADLADKIKRSALKVNVDDLKAKLQFKELQAAADKWDRRTATAKVSLDGADRAELQLMRLNVRLDEFNRKHATATASVARGGIGGLIDKLGQGLAGISALGGSSASAGANVAGAGNGAGSLGMLGLGALSLPFLPALAGLGLGGGVGAAGFYGAYKYDKAQITPALATITRPLSLVSKAIGPSIGMIIAQLGAFTKSEQVPLSRMFASSLPFIQAFANLLEKSGKELIPAFTRSLRALTPFLPQLVQGFMILVNQGLVPLLKNLGPGMKDSVTIFKAVMEVVAVVIRGVGSAATGFAILFARLGDGVRRVAIGMVQGFTDMYHLSARLFQDVVNAAGSAWGLLMQATRFAVVNVIRYFTGMPAGILTSLRGLGETLLHLGSTWLSMLLSGIKSAAHPVLSFLGGFVHTITSIFTGHFNFGSPSKTMYQYGRWVMEGMANGIRDHASKVSGSFAGAASGSAAAAQRYAHSIAGAYGWANQWGAINAVAMRESGWNMTARNPSSGAYGIAQFINGPGEYAQYGGNANTMQGQVLAFFNYIRQRYGSPSAAWAHEMNYGWYDRGGILKQGLTLALNTSGHDEYISTRGQRSGAGDVHLHLHGVSVVDDNAARRMQQVLRAYKTRHGNIPLGLS